MRIHERLKNMMDAGDKERDKCLVTPDGIERFDDISYGEHGVWNLLDVYRPKNTHLQKLPVIFSVHGGGWIYGDKDVYQHYCMELSGHGFVVVNFTYRLSPNIVYPEHLTDVNGAMHWVKDNISRYGGDISKLCMIGDSAGAQMAAMYACALTNPVCREKLSLDVPDVKVRAIVLNCGVYDINDGMRRIDESEPPEEREELIRCILGENYGEAETELGKPANFVTPDFPSAYIMTSNGDFLRYQQHLMTEALEKNGVYFEYHEYGDENEMLWHVFHCNIRTDAAQKCNKAECDFFKKHTEDKIMLVKTPEEYAETAGKLFTSGYNCSQAVLLTFAEELGLPFDMAARLSSSFGGGMGRMREVCGAVSGMFMAAGLLCGYDDPKAQTEKTEHYKRIQELAARFKEHTGSIICRELLGLDIKGADSHVPEKRTEEYYKKRPCKEMVEIAARITAEYFLEI